MDFLDKVKDFIYSYKVNIIIWISLLLIILISNFSVYFILSNRLENINITPTIDYHIEDNKEKPTLSSYKVDVKGAVKTPGVYQLDEGKRIIDVIKMAGGLNENADTSVNNLSKLVKDEMTIIIYTKEEVSNFRKVKEEENIKVDNCQNNNGVIKNDSCIDKPINNENNNPTEDIDIKISINTANLELLMTLPGIGEAKAKSIISYREENGYFEKVEDIMNISGIGESVFEKIKDYITV